MRIFEIQVNEQPDDDIPQLPSRADIEKRKLDHIIKIRKWPPWLKYLDGITYSHFTRCELNIPVPNTEIIEMLFITFDFIIDDQVSRLEEPAKIYAYTAHENISATDSRIESNKILSQVFHTPITDCRTLDHDSTGSEISSQTVDKIFEDFLSTHKNVDSILERIKNLKK